MELRFKAVVTEPEMDIYGILDTQLNAMLNHSLDKEMAFTLAYEYNAVEIRNDDITIKADGVYFTTTRKNYLLFAEATNTHSFFYGKFGILTNKAVSLRTMLRAFNTPMEDCLDYLDELLSESYEWVLPVETINVAVSITHFLMRALIDNQLIECRLTDTKTYKDAEQFAVTMHAYDTRRGEQEYYIEHPKRVVENLRNTSGFVVTDVMLSAAIIHDVIEKTRATFLDLAKHEIFTESLDYLLRSLTYKNYRRESIDTYIKDILESNDGDLLLIKLADVNDNSLINPSFVWADWEEALLRYTALKVNLVNALRTLAGK